MKTTCYCIGCKLHPLHNKRSELSWVTGWDLNHFIYSKYDASAADVDCLVPESDAFGELDVYPEDHEFLVTAYGDDISLTGFEGSGYQIYATCGSEDHED
jgi:hypothetical protein